MNKILILLIVVVVLRFGGWFMYKNNLLKKPDAGANQKLLEVENIDGVWY